MTEAAKTEEHHCLICPPDKECVHLVSDERDDEPTQVTLKLAEMDDAIRKSERCLKDTERKAGKLRRTLRRKDSSQSIKAAVVRANTERPPVPGSNG